MGTTPGYTWQLAPARRGIKTVFSFVGEKVGRHQGATSSTGGSKEEPGGKTWLKTI